MGSVPSRCIGSWYWMLLTFNVLILNPVTLLNVFINWGRTLVVSLWSFYILSAKKDILASSFSVHIILSHFTYFISQSKMSSMIFNKDRRRKQLCLFPYFNENVSSFSSNMILAVGFLYIAFTMLNYVFYIPRFSRHFMKMRCLIFVLDLFCI